MTQNEILPLLGVIVGAFLGFLGNYLIERRRERRKKLEIIKTIECIEVINSKVLDKKTLGPISGEIQIKARETGPDSNFIEVDAIYFARYRIRNLSNVPIENFSLKSLNVPKKVSFSLSEGEGQDSPEWHRRFHELLQERKISEQRGWDEFPVPYLNPYSATRHEIYLDLSSYLPLDEVQISGGAIGVNFVFKKAGGTNL